MKKDMIDYIRETPSEIQQILQNDKQIFAEYVCLLSDSIEKIYLVGSGSSLNAAIGAVDLMEQVLQIEVEPVKAMAFTDRTFINSNSIVIGISQGGISESTIEALDRAKEAAIKTLAVSGNDNAGIINHADVFLPLHISEEHVGPKTKGVYATIAELDLLALRWAETLERITADQAQGYRNQLEDELSQMCSRIEEIALWYQKNKAVFQDINQIVLVGDDHVAGTVAEGSLKMLECLECLVHGYELEEFMHGIYHAMDNKTLIIGIGFPDRHYARLVRLLQYLRKEYDAKAVLISNKEEDDITTFVYPFMDNVLFSTFSWLIFLQVIARYVSLDRGIDCCATGKSEFHKVMQSYRY